MFEAVETKPFNSVPLVFCVQKHLSWERLSRECRAGN